MSIKPNPCCERTAVFYKSEMERRAEQRAAYIKCLEDALKQVLEIDDIVDGYSYNPAPHVIKHTSVEMWRIAFNALYDTHCHGGRDGECNWSECPQERDYQKHCPLDIEDSEL